MMCDFVEREIAPHGDVVAPFLLDLAADEQKPPAQASATSGSPARDRCGA